MSEAVLVHLPKRPNRLRFFMACSYSFIRSASLAMPWKVGFTEYLTHLILSKSVSLIGSKLILSPPVCSHQRLASWSLTIAISSVLVVGVSSTMQSMWACHVPLRWLWLTWKL